MKSGVPALLTLLLVCAAKAQADEPPATDKRPMPEVSPDVLQETPPRETHETTRVALEDPLKVGGLMYLRADAGLADLGRTWSVGGLQVPRPELQGFALPALVDVYLDARPHEHVRGMVVGRLIHDPALNPYPAPTVLGGRPEPAPPNPTVALDQLWLRFDIGGRLFVTLGRQHVKWGTGRFWSPTDFLSPLKRDILARFDTRLGTDMVRLQLPVLGTATNFYAIGLVNTQGPASQPLRFGAAARAETVFLGAEVGASAVAQQGRKPRYGLDVSMPLGLLDFTGELALRTDTDVPLWRTVASPSPDGPYSARFEPYPLQTVYPQATLGLALHRSLDELHALSIGVEFFYNGAGYQGADVLPWLLLQDAYQPFYAASAYAGGFASYEWGDLDRKSLTLTTLANLADGSYLSRLDVGLRWFTVLELELFLAVPFGTRGGEFRFGLELPAQELGDGRVSQPVSVPTPLFELGAGFRIKL